MGCAPGPCGGYHILYPFTSLSFLLCYHERNTFFRPHSHHALVPHGGPKCNRVSPPQESRSLPSLKDSSLRHIVHMMESCPIHLPSSCSFLREAFSSDLIKATTPYILYMCSSLCVVRPSELSKYAPGLMNRTH